MNFALNTILRGISNADYHAHEAISKSGLDKIAISPAHYQAYLQGKGKRTAVLEFGSALHDYILLPQNFQNDYIVLPEAFNSRTKDGKAQLEAWQEDGKIIIKNEDFEKIQAMAQSVQNHPAASELLKVGESEVSIFWQDENTSELCRCRPDFLNEQYNVIVDLKTTQDASPKGFAKSMANYRYHVQAAFYMQGVYQATGIYPERFIFVAIEKEPPYAVGVYDLNNAAIELGRELYQRDLLTFHQAKQSHQWQAYNQGIETLSLPAWAFY